MIPIDCPECGEGLKDSADTCPHCQKPLPNSVKQSLLDRARENTAHNKDTPGHSNYFLRHWRGELSLAKSFWVNLLLLNVVLAVHLGLIFAGLIIEYPVIIARAGIVLTLVWLVIVYPWQLVGIWRCCTRYRITTGKTFWPGLVKMLIVLGFLGLLKDATEDWPLYKALFNLGYQRDVNADYSIELEKNSNLIYLEGGLGFGVSREIEDLLHKQPNITGIILDSPGGWLHEGRKLSKVVLAHGLNTYSIAGCYSACTIPFVSGKNRRIAAETHLGFHQYSNFDESFDSFTDVKSHQNMDLKAFKKQGVQQEFLTRIFDASPDKFWLPPISELLSAGVIHGVVDPFDLNAKAAYQMGLAAKERLDHETAWKALTRAAELIPDSALYLNEAGMMADTLGHHDTAITYYEDALASDLRSYGSEHPLVAIRWANLGSAWHDKGEFDTAIGYYEKTLASDLSSYGSKHPLVATTWNSLGLAFNGKHNYDKAIWYYEKALNSNLNTFGPEHPSVATGWNDLGSAWQDKGENDKAREHYEKALGIVKKLGLKKRILLMKKNIRSLPSEK